LSAERTFYALKSAEKPLVAETNAFRNVRRLNFQAHLID
jgi:hypothetical protein